MAPEESDTKNEGTGSKGRLIIIGPSLTGPDIARLMAQELMASQTILLVNQEEAEGKISLDYEGHLTPLEKLSLEKTLFRVEKFDPPEVILKPEINKGPKPRRKWPREQKGKRK